MSSKTASAAPAVRNRDISTTGLAVKFWALAAAPAATVAAAQTVTEESMAVSMTVFLGALGAGITLAWVVRGEWNKLNARIKRLEDAERRRRK